MPGWLGTPLIGRNPLITHITGQSRLFRGEDAIFLAPWLLVFAGEIGLIQMITVSPITAFTMALLAGVLMPPAAGYLIQWHAFAHAAHVGRRVPLAELAVTAMKPEEIVSGLALRPIAVARAGLALHALGSCIFAFAFFVAGWGSPTDCCGLLVAGGALFFQVWLTAAGQRFAFALAMRSFVFFADPKRAATRASLEWTSKFILWVLVAFAIPLLGFLPTFIYMWLEKAGIHIPFPLYFPLVPAQGALYAWLAHKFVLAKLPRGINGPAVSILDESFHHARRWWFYAGEQWRAVPAGPRAGWEAIAR